MIYAVPLNDRFRKREHGVFALCRRLPPPFHFQTELYVGNKDLLNQPGIFLNGILGDRSVRQHLTTINVTLVAQK